MAWTGTLIESIPHPTMGEVTVLIRKDTVPQCIKNWHLTKPVTTAKVNVLIDAYGAKIDALYAIVDSIVVGNIYTLVTDGADIWNGKILAKRNWDYTPSIASLRDRDEQQCGIKIGLYMNDKFQSFLLLEIEVGDTLQIIKQKAIKEVNRIIEQRKNDEFSGI